MEFKNVKINYLNIFLFLLIFLFGVYLRVVGINKPEGLWYDEMNTYFIAKQSFPFGIMQNLLERDLHFPFYYMLLHVWMNIFGNSDVALRFLSVLFGILTLPTAYFVGKELNGPKLGFITLLMFSINSGLIYYSQEVRFYFLIAFLATLSILFLVKIKTKPTKLCFLGLIISNVLIMYTWTIGCIFIFIEIVMFLAYLIYTKREIKDFIVSGIIMLVLCLPIIPLLIYFSIKNSQLLFNYFDYYKFDFYRVLSVIEGISGSLAPRSVINVIDSKSYLILISTMIFFLFIIKSITQRKILLTLFLIGLIPFLLELIFSMLGKFSLIYCHIIFSVPFFIIVASCALFNFKNKFIFLILLIAYLFINLIYTNFSFEGVNSIKNADGLNFVSKELNSLHATKQDVLLLIPFGGYLTIKYDYKAKVVPLCLNDYSLNSGEALGYVFDSEFVSSLNKDNIYSKLKSFVYSPLPTLHFENFIQNEMLDKVPLNRYAFVVVIDYGTLSYSKDHMIDSIMDKITKDTFYILNKDKKYVLDRLTYLGCWSFFTFKRIR